MKEVILKSIDADVLRATIASDVVQAIKPILTEVNEPRLVDGDRMAELLSVSRPTLDRAVKQNLIPSVRIGRRRLFEPRKVIDALSESNV